MSTTNQPGFAHLWALVDKNGWMHAPQRTRREAIKAYLCDDKRGWKYWKRVAGLRCVRVEAREIFTSLDYLTDAQTNDLAVKIVKGLMQPGQRKVRAARLQLRGPNEENFGGWGHSGAVDCVAKVLFAARKGGAR